MLYKFCTVRRVRDEAKVHLRQMSPAASPTLIDEVSALVETMFEGRHPDYQRVDLRYHSLRWVMWPLCCTTAVI